MTGSKLMNIPPSSITNRDDSGNKNSRNDIRVYDIFWVFTVGSFVGFILETIWAFLVHGHLLSRTSLMFLPFTVIYGFGAVVLYIGLSKISIKNYVQIFLFGSLAGTLVEFIGSYIQEAVFGSISWDYSNSFLNIGGRVCLRMSLLWGVLAIGWAMWIQPAFNRLISKLSTDTWKVIAMIIAIVLIISACLSAIAVIRWTSRIAGTADTSDWGLLIDSIFSNKLMETVYSNMKFLFS